jgi:hypothetical protein
MTVRHISPFDQWMLDNAGQVVGIQLTDSTVVTNLPDGNPVTKVDFILNPGIEADTGELVWNPEEETLDLGLAQSAVLHIGQDTLYHVENHTGSAIPKGTLCQFAGTSGNSGKLRVAPWTGAQPSFTLMGIALTQIPNGGNGGTGYVVHFGKVRGIQTNGANYGETWASGDVLYAGTSGGLTNVLPEAPSGKSVVAAVVSAHPNNGELFVRPQVGSNLNNDELVQLAGLASRDVIQYNASTLRFENGPPVLTAPASATPALNRDVVMQLASNTSLVIKVKGTDGVVRSVTLTLA